LVKLLAIPGQIEKADVSNGKYLRLTMTRSSRTEKEADLSGACRIVTFTTLYPSSTQPNHGIFVENRLRHLVASGLVRARIVAPVPWFPLKDERFGRYAKFARTPSQETWNGLNVVHPRYFTIPKLGMSLAPAFLAASAGPLLQRWQAEFDLIDAHYFFPDGVAAVQLARRLNKPVVVTARGTDVNLIPRYRIPRRMIAYAARHADAIIAVSQALKDALIALGVAPHRITVLRNGVDLEMFRPGDREAERSRLGLRAPALLSVGHLIERKGHDLVIKALKRLPVWILLIAGDGPEFGALKELAQRLGVSDRVRFLGAVPHPELRPIYSAADILVLASSREGWPNVLLEAMACGTPVAATSIWGNPEIVSNPNAGVLIRERTPEAIAESVDQLFSALPLREQTRAFAEEFSWDQTSAGQIQLFRQLIRARSGGE
jgi:teichuronic acid biosynthesis glycosyltransferase TuaC